MKLSDLFEMPAHAIDGAGQEAALAAFRTASTRVPAYQDFLRQHGVDPSKIRTIEDFRTLPLIDKKSYLRAYPIDALCLDGDLSAMHTVTATSGTSGEECHIAYIPEQEQAITPAIEGLFNAFFEVGERRTLVLVTYALGTGSAGMLAAGACKQIAMDPRYRMTVVTPGIDHGETVRLVRKFASHYDQIILLGYPPFVRDVLELGIEDGVDWSSINLKLWVGGEGHSETWRDVVMQKAGIRSPVDVLSVFGTTEAGVVGFETPTTVTLRRAARDSAALAEQLFGSGSDPVPMVMQYLPMARHFEAVDDELVVTSGNQGMPLVRYNLHDRGGVIPFARLPEQFRTKRALPVPVFYVFGRTDGLLLHGVSIHVEQLVASLEDERLREYHTTRFKISTTQEGDELARFHVKIELKEGVDPTPELQGQFESLLPELLRNANHVYGTLCGLKGEEAHPIVHLRAYNTEEFALEDGAKRKYFG